MAIYYRGRCIRITHEVVEVRCPAYRTYDLRGLCQLRVVEHAVGPLPIQRVVGTGSTSVAGATAVVAAIGWLEGWQVLESPAGMLAVLILLLVTATVGGACWRARPVERELAAAYQGRPVTLYRSADSAAFGQVRRGLLRALQHQRDTR